MSKTLIITTGLTGILNASFELASRRISEGEECVLCSPADVGNKVRAQGFKYLQFDPVNFDPAPEISYFNGPLRKLKRLFHKYLFRKERKEQALHSLGMDSFLAKMKQEKPDLILIDMELHEHIMTLVAHDFNIKLLSQWFSTWNRKGLPPIVTDIILGEGFRGSAFGIKCAWTKIKVQRWWMFYKKKLLSAGTDRRSILLQYADKVGFSRNLIKENYWPGPISYDQLPVLSMTSEQLEFPHDQRPNLEYIGAMVYEKRIDIDCPEDTLQKISQLIELKIEKNQKLIYCSVSTFEKGDQGFIQKVIEAVSEHKEWMLIIGLGGKLDLGSVEELPANVHAFKYVPQMQVLKEADLSINHGGIHTINECVHYGVPMLVYSGKRSDQNGCAARVQYHGLGLMGDKDREHKEAIRKKIERLV